jgi:hypothetical protein
MELFDEDEDDDDAIDDESNMPYRLDGLVQ